MICPYINFFKWIDKNRMQHKQHTNRFRVKKFKVAATIELDNVNDMKLPEINKTNSVKVPEAPGIGDLLAPSTTIKYLERDEGDS